jgi:hypothetical protein
MRSLRGSPNLDRHHPYRPALSWVHFAGHDRRTPAHSAVSKAPNFTTGLEDSSLLKKAPKADSARRSCGFLQQGIGENQRSDDLESLAHIQHSDMATLLVRVLENNTNSRLCLPVSNASKLKIINCMAAELKGLTCAFNPHI